MARTLNRGFFEGQTSERDIDTNSGTRTQEQHAPSQRELHRIGNTSLKSFKQPSYERLFIANAGEEGKVHIDGFARFAPALLLDKA